MRIRTSYSVQYLGFAPAKVNMCDLVHDKDGTGAEEVWCHIEELLMQRQCSSLFLYEVATPPGQGCEVGAAGFSEICRTVRSCLCVRQWLLLVLKCNYLPETVKE